jgi:hypothetical protein
MSPKVAPKDTGRAGYVKQSRKNAVPAASQKPG